MRTFSIGASIRAALACSLQSTSHMFISARSEQCDLIGIGAPTFCLSSKDDKILRFYIISVSFFYVFIVNN